MRKSPRYDTALNETKAHHAESKTYSGSLLRPHKPFLSEMITRLGVRSALDYGAGKGVQYAWIDPDDGKTLEEAWGFPVVKYDPAWPPYAAEPEGSFDLVICSHTLGCIPIADLRWVIPRLLSLSNRGVFIAEKIGKPKKRVHSDESYFPKHWDKGDWLTVIGRHADDYPSTFVVFSSRERLPEGAIMTRHLRRAGEWVVLPPGENV